MHFYLCTYLQHDLSFSPHNAQVALMDSYQLHAFLSVGRLDSGRTAITYHIIPSSEVREREREREMDIRLIS